MKFVLGKATYVLAVNSKGCVAKVLPQYVDILADPSECSSAVSFSVLSVLTSKQLTSKKKIVSAGFTTD